MIRVIVIVLLGATVCPAQVPQEEQEAQKLTLQPDSDALAGIRRYRGKTVYAWMQGLASSRSESERLVALDAMRAVGLEHRVVVAAVIVALQDRSESVRQRAQALLVSNAQHSLPALCRVVESKRRRRRDPSSPSSGLLGGLIDEVGYLVRGPESWPRVSQAVAPQVLQVLPEIGGGEAARVLVTAIADRRLRAVALAGLFKVVSTEPGEVGKGAAEIGRVAVEDPRLRPGALLLLNRLGPHGSGAVASMVRLLKQEYSRELFDALAAVGPGARAAKGLLEEALQDLDPLTRCRAAKALASVDPGSALALEAIKPAFQDPRRGEDELLAEACQAASFLEAPGLALLTEYITGVDQELRDWFDKDWQPRYGEVDSHLYGRKPHGMDKYEERYKGAALRLFPAVRALSSPGLWKTSEDAARAIASVRRVLTLGGGVDRHASKRSLIVRTERMLTMKVTPAHVQALVAINGLTRVFPELTVELAKGLGAETRLWRVPSLDARGRIADIAEAEFSVELIRLLATHGSRAAIDLDSHQFDWRVHWWLSFYASPVRDPTAPDRRRITSLERAYFSALDDLLVGYGKSALRLLFKRRDAFVYPGTRSVLRRLIDAHQALGHELLRGTLIAAESRLRAAPQGQPAYQQLNAELEGLKQLEASLLSEGGK